MLLVGGRIMIIVVRLAANPTEQFSLTLSTMANGLTIFANATVYKYFNLSSNNLIFHRIIKLFSRVGSLSLAAAVARKLGKQKNEVGRFAFEPTNLAFAFISRDFH